MACITTPTDLCSRCEWIVEANGEDIPWTSFAIVDSDDNAYYGVKERMRVNELTVDIVKDNLQPVPDEEIYPGFPMTGLTAAPDDYSGRYVKRTAWADYEEVKGTTFLARLMLQEAHTMEFLSQRPHPNIVNYYGCQIKRDRITGLVLETFSLEHDLGFAAQRPELFKGLVDKNRIMSGLRAAVDHLHAIGLAHNDINPANIMLGEEGEPKLIDFGSCQPIGHHLMSCGTPGWYKDMFHLSDAAHDDYSLELLGPWLEKMFAEEK
ncbi:kinase-like domain-containing protein [Trichoderma sp. SZMC 28012]